jgi:hypothetical protein
MADGAAIPEGDLPAPRLTQTTPKKDIPGGTCERMLAPPAQHRPEGGWFAHLAPGYGERRRQDAADLEGEALQLPGQTVIRAPAPPGRGSSASCAALRDWYAAVLRSKLARAVADGRADAGRAAELDRLAIPADPAAPGGWDLTGQLRVSGTRRLLDAALACRVPRYLQQSIVMAYRDGGDAWLDEQAPLDDSPARAASCGPVIEMEAMIRNTEHRLVNWTILRGSSFVGARTA